MEEQPIKIDREKLYKEIWEMAVTGVSKKYNVPYSRLMKICKENSIPTPPAGYWTSISFGKQVEKIPLPPTKGATEKIGPRSFEEVNVSPERAETLGFLDDKERKKILDAATQLELTTENERLHKKIVAYRFVVNEWNKKDTKTEGAQRGFKNYSNRPPFLAGVISIESLPRVYRILDALYREVESLGGSINDDLSLLIRNEHVMIEIAEGQDEIKHEITRQEAQEMIKYEDAKRHHSWATEPKIRKYDYTFNGRLRISVRQGRYFRDTDNIKIESKLGEMLIELYEESEVVRIDRENREEAARKREEEAKSQEDRRNRYNDEVERTIELQNEALDFQISSRIRAYVEAVKNVGKQVELDDKTIDWIEWATKKADWFDPAVARSDELFGKRQHSKKEEEKALRRAGYYW